MSEKIPDATAVAFLMQNLAVRNDHFRIGNSTCRPSAPRSRGCVPFRPSWQRGDLDGPATLITGSLSDYVTPADSAALVEQFPGHRRVEIDGAGHWVHADQPAGFLAALGLVPAIAARAHAPTPADVQRSVLMFPWRRPA